MEPLTWATDAGGRGHDGGVLHLLLDLGQLGGGLVERRPGLGLGPTLAGADWRVPWFWARSRAAWAALTVAWAELSACMAWACTTGTWAWALATAALSASEVLWSCWQWVNRPWADTNAEPVRLGSGGTGPLGHAWVYSV